jgi:hypothetical protein
MEYLHPYVDINESKNIELEAEIKEIKRRLIIMTLEYHKIYNEFLIKVKKQSIFFVNYKKLS